MIKFVFRWAFRFLLLAIVLVVALLLLKDEIIKAVAERQIRSSTGMDVKIGGLHVGLTRPVFQLENFILYNTAEFGGGAFLDIPDLYLEMHPEATRQQQLRFKLVRMNVRELTIVESRDGRTNITSIAGALDSMQRRSTNSRENFEFKGIDVLNLTVGKVRYTSLRTPQRNQEMNVAFQNEVVQNVRSWNDMAGVLFKVLFRAGVTFFLEQPAPAPAPSRKTNAPAPVQARPPRR